MPDDVTRRPVDAQDPALRSDADRPDDRTGAAPKPAEAKAPESLDPGEKPAEGKPAEPKSPGDKASGDKASGDKPADGKEGAGKDGDDPNDARRKKARPFVRIILIVVVLALIAGGVWYWLGTRNIESTDDAYTDGRAITLAPQISGQIVTLAVNDNQFVHKGDPIVVIDPRQYRFAREQAAASLADAEGQLAGQRFGAEIARKNFPAMLEQAQAKLASAKANLLKAQQDANRQRSLARGATTQQEVDAANAGLTGAQAQVLDAQAGVDIATPVAQRIGQADANVQQQSGQVGEAQAKLDQASLNLSWTTVAAPQDGWITKRNVEVGDYVTAGQQITALVSPEVWITANFKEDQLDHLRIGQKVDVSVDAYPSLKLVGHVDSVQLGSGTKFTAFPPENATGNFVKIVQRVPVKIVIDSGLEPAMRAAARALGDPTVASSERRRRGGTENWKPKGNPWLIAVVVTLAAFMEVLDTTIVNVSLPHIAGSLSSSYDDATWALTSYLVANGIVLTISGWLGGLLGRKRYFLICVGDVHRLLVPVRHRHQPAGTDHLPPAAGLLRRRAAAEPAIDHPRHLPAGEARQAFASPPSPPSSRR